jgi:Uma2 family endonuclease
MKMAIQERLYTADDLWKLQQRPEYEDKSLELLDGVIYEVSPSGAVPGMIAAMLAQLLGVFVHENTLGYIVTAEGGFELSPNNVVAPDVGFVAKARITKPPERYFQLAPDLAVEVVSPTDSLRKVQRKAKKYLAFGVREVWIVYPDDQTVDVCRPANEGAVLVQEFGKSDTLDGGDILPGLRLPVNDLFAFLPEDEETGPADTTDNSAKGA